MNYQPFQPQAGPSLAETIFIAYIFDLIIGDPQWRWHPVRIIGRLIEFLERGLNKDNFNKMFSGGLLVIFVVGLVIFCVWTVLILAKIVHIMFYYIVSVLFIYFAISAKALAAEADKIYRALTARDIQKARNSLSMIVGRDTDKLNEPEIIRATVETVAEGTMDGVIAPVFYAFLGGPVLVWAYKAINTLDSMVGYRSERYIDFGKLSAKLDGLVNFIPAKITCFLILVSAFCCRKDSLRVARCALRYFLKGPRDNSEATEAAMAAALGIQLGGINFYKSVPLQKQFIGENIYPLNVKHIQESINLSYISSFLFMVIGTVLLLIIERR